MEKAKEHIPKHLIYKQSLALFTDLYELTMAYGYWKTKILDREAIFHLTFRKWPFKGGFAVAAGLQTFVDFIEDFRFSQSDLQYLASLKDSAKKPLFEEGFLEYLADFRFEGDIDALEEGTLVFPYEPLIRIKAPILQAQILESAVLNIINYQTLIATKAARIKLATGSDTLVEFGMRRAQGIDGAIAASRASYIGGAESTSHVLAGKLFNIPVKGTMAHSWVMAFDDERESFESFAEILPHNCIFLIDTYDSIKGVRNVIEVAKNLEGFDLLGVRLDSGDLAHLSIQIRKILDQEGFTNAKIMASNELDEYLIQDLKQQGSAISIWGVGTNLVTGKDQPALDGVYKLTAIQNSQGCWIDKIKISEQTAKITIPGFLQTRRFFDKKGKMRGDAIYDFRDDLKDKIEVFGIPDENHKMTINEKGSFKDLLVPIYRKGKLVYQHPPLSEMRQKCIESLQYLDPRMKRFTNPHPYFVGLEKALFEKRRDLIEEMRKK